MALQPLTFAAGDTRLIRYIDTVYKVKLEYDIQGSPASVGGNCLAKEVERAIKVLICKQVQLPSSLVTTNLRLRCTRKAWVAVRRIGFRQDGRILRGHPEQFIITVSQRNTGKASKTANDATEKQESSVAEKCFTLQRESRPSEGEACLRPSEIQEEIQNNEYQVEYPERNRREDGERRDSSGVHCEVHHDEHQITDNSENICQKSHLGTRRRAEHRSCENSCGPSKGNDSAGTSDHEKDNSMNIHPDSHLKTSRRAEDRSGKDSFRPSKRNGSAGTSDHEKSQTQPHRTLTLQMEETKSSQLSRKVAENEQTSRKKRYCLRHKSIEKQASTSSSSSQSSNSLRQKIRYPTRNRRKSNTSKKHVNLEREVKTGREQNDKTMSVNRQTGRPHVSTHHHMPKPTRPQPTTPPGYRTGNCSNEQISTHVDVTQKCEASQSSDSAKSSLSSGHSHNLRKRNVHGRYVNRSHVTSADCEAESTNLVSEETSREKDYHNMTKRSSLLPVSCSVTKDGRDEDLKEGKIPEHGNGTHHGAQQDRLPEATSDRNPSKQLNKGGKWGESSNKAPEKEPPTFVRDRPLSAKIPRKPICEIPPRAQNPTPAAENRNPVSSSSHPRRMYWADVGGPSTRSTSREALCYQRDRTLIQQEEMEEEAKLQQMAQIIPLSECSQRHDELKSDNVASGPRQSLPAQRSQNRTVQHSSHNRNRRHHHKRRRSSLGIAWDILIYPVKKILRL